MPEGEVEGQAVEAIDLGRAGVQGDCVEGIVQLKEGGKRQDLNLTNLMTPNLTPNLESNKTARKPAPNQGPTKMVQRLICKSWKMNNDATDAMHQFETVLSSMGGYAGIMYRLAKEHKRFDILFQFTDKNFGEASSTGTFPHGGTVVFEKGTKNQLTPRKYTSDEIKRISETGIEIVILIYTPGNENIGKLLSTLVHEFGVHATTWMPLIEEIFWAGKSESAEKRGTPAKTFEEVAELLGKILPNKEQDDHVSLAKEEHTRYNSLKASMISHLWWSYTEKWNKVYSDFQKDVGRDIDEHRVRLLKLKPIHDPDMIKGYENLKETVKSLSDINDLKEKANALTAFAEDHARKKK